MSNKADTSTLRALLANPDLFPLPWAKDGDSVIADRPHGVCTVAKLVDREERDLIVAAVNALPTLLDEVERLRAECGGARVAQACAEDAIDEWQDERAALWKRTEDAERIAAASLQERETALVSEVARLTTERDEARAEAERLRVVEAAAREYVRRTDPHTFTGDSTDAAWRDLRAALGDRP